MLSPEPNILIIGAGVAGLSAGIYAQMNGFQSTIYEMHTIPGGLCTSWQRKGYIYRRRGRYLAGLTPRLRAISSGTSW